MRPPVSYPGVYIEETARDPKTIEGVPTSVTAFAGYSTRGPKDRAQPVSSWTEFEETFCKMNEHTLFDYSVKHFFENGGKNAYILRIASAAADTALEPNTPAFEKLLLPEDGRDGLYLLDEVDTFNLLCVPGETNPPILMALEEFCRHRRAFLIADSAADASPSDLEQGTSISSRETTNAAFYFPWVTDLDISGAQRTFPPSGYVAGVFARTDAFEGVWKAPAGTRATLQGGPVLMPSIKLTDQRTSLLNKNAINCIREFSSTGTVIWGSRTLAGKDGFASELKYVPVRRLALYIEASISRGLSWVVFEPNGEPLWATLRLHIGNFMHQLFRNGAFQGSAPNHAFFVKCDRDTTSQKDVDDGIVNIVIGFAPLKPAEFVIINLTQITARKDGQEEELL